MREGGYQFISTSTPGKIKKNPKSALSAANEDLVLILVLKDRVIRLWDRLKRLPILLH